MTSSTPLCFIFHYPFALSFILFTFRIATHKVLIFFFFYCFVLFALHKSFRSDSKHYLYFFIITTTSTDLRPRFSVAIFVGRMFLFTIKIKL